MLGGLRVTITSTIAHTLGLKYETINTGVKKNRSNASLGVTKSPYHKYSASFNRIPQQNGLGIASPNRVAVPLEKASSSEANRSGTQLVTRLLSKQVQVGERIRLSRIPSIKRSRHEVEGEGVGPEGVEKLRYINPYLGFSRSPSFVGAV